MHKLPSVVRVYGTNRISAVGLGQEEKLMNLFLLKQILPIAFAFLTVELTGWNWKHLLPPSF